MTDYLKPALLNTYNTPLESIQVIADTLREMGINNIVTLNKSRVMILFSRMEIFTNNNTVVINNDLDMDSVVELNILLRKCDSVVITGVDGRCVEYGKSTLLAIHGLTVGNHLDLSIEYHKSKIFDILYADSNVFELFNRNPLSSSGVDIFRLLDINPSHCLLDDEISLIDQYTKQVGCNVDNYLKLFKIIRNNHRESPIKTVINRSSVTISIYSDIRGFRFDELRYLKDMKDEDEVNNNFGSY